MQSIVDWNVMWYVTILTSDMKFRHVRSKTYIFFLSFYLVGCFFWGEWLSFIIFVSPVKWSAHSLENTKSLKGFRMCYLKMWHLCTLNILSWRSLRKKQRQESHSDLLPLILLPWKEEINLSCERNRPWTREEGGVLITRDRKFRDENKQIMLFLCHWVPLGQAPYLVNSSPISCFFVSKVEKLPAPVTSGLSFSYEGSHV